MCPKQHAVPTSAKHPLHEQSLLARGLVLLLFVAPAGGRCLLHGKARVGCLNHPACGKAAEGALARRRRQAFLVALAALFAAHAC